MAAGRKRKEREAESGSTTTSPKSTSPKRRTKATPSPYDPASIDSGRFTSATAADSSIPAVVASTNKLVDVRIAAQQCRACDLWKTATQTVFGEGPSRSRIMLVGEQPGDQEDRAGHPFVGPAGRLLRQAMMDAGIDPSHVYLTNVVKHFKWSAAQRGKKRIHKKPRYSEIHACRPWLDAELRMVKPKVLVCLGATAAQSLLARSFSVTQQRGQLVNSPLADCVIATVHPSSILRAPDEESRHQQMQAFIADLKTVANLARKVDAA